jgi:hypothetical protein
MNSVFKEYVIAFVDLKLVSIVCQNCNAEMIVDVTRERPIFPDLCPCCGNLFSESFVEAIRTFYNIYKHLTNKDVNASARIRICQESNMAEL